MKKCQLKENYYPVITTEIRHDFLLVWMGNVGREVLSGAAGEPDFHFEGNQMEEILKFFDEKSIGLMSAGYPVVSRAIPDRYIRIAEGKIMKKSQIKSIIKVILNEALLGGVFGRGQNMTPAQKMTVDLLTKRSFRFVRSVPGEGGTTNVVLERPWGKGRHGGPRFAVVTQDGTIGKDKLNVNKYLSVVGEMIVNKDEKPGADAFGFVNVSEITDPDKLLEEAKKLAEKIWKDKVQMVSPFPAKSTTEYFKVNLGNDGTEWLALTQTSGWLYSKDNKMVSVNDLGVNEKTNPDGTYTDDMESGMKAKAYSGLKEGRWAMGEYTPEQQQSINILQKKGYREVASFPNEPDAEGEGQDNQVIVVLQKKTSGFGHSQVEVDPQGMCNGQPIQDYLKANLREGLHDQRPCDCGSGQMSHWELDGRGIPLCRVCPACKQKKLSRYRPEILKHYTQADVDEPIEPDGDDLWEVNSGHKYWMSYTEHNMVAAKKSNDIVALLRHAKNVGADQFGIYNQQPGFHSTTQQEFLVAWYDKSGSGYWSNMAKKNPELRKIQIKSLDALPAPKIKEQTSSGAVFSGGPTIQTPAWGTRNKQGSPRAIKAAKKYGKVVKSISEKVA